MKIGIPRAFLYFTYRHLWETFFNELGCEIVLSPETNRKILNDGIKYSIDEACLSSKIYLGHVYSLIGECDYILVPRIASFGAGEIMCTKFGATYDLVVNTFRDYDIKVLDYNVDIINKKTEFAAFLAMGKVLKKKKFEILRAYFMAKQAEKLREQIAIDEQNKLLGQDGMKILLISHPYNLYDKYVGEPIINYLEELGCTPIIGNVNPKNITKLKAKEVSETLPWSYSQELMGAILLYKEKVDGIVLITSFPCGPDSLVNEMIIRTNKDKPIITLIIDGQDGTAGLETRLESFVDIIKLKKEGNYEKKS